MQTQRTNDEFPPAATVDYQEPKEIVLYLRALLDLANLLERGYDAELQDFLVNLRKVGWGQKQIAEFILQSSQFTRYEEFIDRPIPNRGDQFEFENNEYRWRH